MELNRLSPAPGSTKNRKRLGRGPASGQGKTAGKGSKGHNCRSGGGVRPGFEGGQMPIHRRIPKRGFTNIFAKHIAVVNVRDLSLFASGSVVDGEMLREKGLVKGRVDGIKLLGNGELTQPLTVKVSHVSRSAREKVEAAGGSIEVTA